MEELPGFRFKVTIMIMFPKQAADTAIPASYSTWQVLCGVNGHHSDATLYSSFYSHGMTKCQLHRNGMDL